MVQLELKDIIDDCKHSALCLLQCSTLPQSLLKTKHCYLASNCCSEPWGMLLPTQHTADLCSSCSNWCRREMRWCRSELNGDHRCEKSISMCNAMICVTKQVSSCHTANSRRFHIKVQCNDLCHKAGFIMPHCRLTLFQVVSSRISEKQGSVMPPVLSR